MDTKTSLEHLKNINPLDGMKRENTDFILSYRLGQRIRIKKLEDESLKEEYFSEIAKNTASELSIFELLKKEIEKRKLMSFPQKYIIKTKDNN